MELNHEKYQCLVALARTKLWISYITRHLGLIVIAT